MKRRGAPSQARRKKFLWITDPWGTLDHRNDTSIRLLLEAQELGHESHWCDVKTIRWANGRISLNAVEVTPGLELKPVGPKSPQDYHQLHYRTDPPVDLDYLHPLQLLVLGLPERGRATTIVNPHPILLEHNEKIEASYLGSLMPPTLVSSNWEEFLSFGTEEGRTVMKPLHQAQSKGVELLKWTTADEIRESRQALLQETHGFTSPVLVQRYLEGIADGETRLWYVDGKLLTQVRKLPLHGDFRVNIDQGSPLAEHELGRKEAAAAQKIGRHLKSRGIRLAAVDLIDGYVTDFNFTSPGLITHMEKLLSENLAKPIIQALARS